MSATNVTVTKQDLDRLADEIKQEHEAVVLALRDSLAHARRAGDLLIEAKGKLAHGTFMAWVEATCPFAHRTATLYMQVAREWDRIEANWQHVANFGIAAASRWLSGHDEPQKEAAADDEQPACSAVMMRVEQLKPHQRNYQQHPADQREHLKRSIEANGVYRAVVVARDNTILAGHGLVAAATELGCVRVPVVRLDVDPNEPRALKILAGDNEIGQTADRDTRKLAHMLAQAFRNDDELCGTGFDKMQLTELINVTRPPDCITKFGGEDAAAEWAGMPEYEQQPPAIRLIITFPSEAERAKYVKEHRVPVLKKSDKLKVWSARVPEVSRNDLSSLRWTTEVAER